MLSNSNTFFFGPTIRAESKKSYKKKRALFFAQNEATGTFTESWIKRNEEPVLLQLLDALTVQTKTHSEWKQDELHRMFDGQPSRDQLRRPALVGRVGEGEDVGEDLRTDGSTGGGENMVKNQGTQGQLHKIRTSENNNLELSIGSIYKKTGEVSIVSTSYYSSYMFPTRVPVVSWTNSIWVCHEPGALSSTEDGDDEDGETEIRQQNAPPHPVGPDMPRYRWNMIWYPGHSYAFMQHLQTFKKKREREREMSVKRADSDANIKKWQTNFVSLQHAWLLLTSLTKKSEAPPIFLLSGGDHEGDEHAHATGHLASA